MSANAYTPAYPIPGNPNLTGVSRREWFAGMALSGVVMQGLAVQGDRVISDEERIMMLARKSYDLADAMIMLSDAHRQQTQAKQAQAQGQQAQGQKAQQAAAQLPAQAAT